MRYSTTTLLALAAGANAHTLFSEFYVNGVGQGSGTCIRTPFSAEGAVDPIKDLGSNDMVCGKNGETGVARTCPVTAGSSITFEYRQWPDDAARGSIDHGHMGPCAVYLKKVGDATSDSGAGDGWFKIFAEGYDANDSGPNPWCTQRLEAENNGRLTVTLPESLQAGDYLVRPELLALHNAGPKGSPEFYVGCAQIYLSSTGNSGPASTVSIPGYVDHSSPSVTFDVWASPMSKDYPIPGPDVVSLTTAWTTAEMSQSHGLSSNCVVSNANWCGTELPDYSDETGCWAADKDCWSQVDACWAAAGATGGVGCDLMSTKCYTNQAVCKGSNPSGPPGKGTFLGPQAVTIGTPNALNYGINYGSGSGYNAPVSSAASSAASTSSSAPAYSAPSSSSAPWYPPASSSTTSWSAPAYSAPAYSSPSYNDKGAWGDAPAWTTTTYAPATTGDPNVVVVTETDCETVTDEVYVTAAAPGYKRHLHAHQRKHARRQ